jgi:hypothetical protein
MWFIEEGTQTHDPVYHTEYSCSVVVTEQCAQCHRPGVVCVPIDRAHTDSYEALVGAHTAWLTYGMMM